MAQERAVSNIGTRQLFAPYFKARWQNMQNIKNEVFYALVPKNYLTYYNAFIRQWMEWASGFVKALHRTDFFSTGMGYTVCDIFATECTSGGLRYESTNKKAQAFITDWAEKNLNDKLCDMFFYSNAGGNCILKVTPVNGKIIVDVVPIDRVFFQEGRDGITYAQMLNRFIAGSDSCYYARETRVKMDGKPYYKVDLSEQANEQVLSPVWNANFQDGIPEGISNAWAETYGDIMPGVWYELPSSFNTLGVYNVRNKGCAVALSGIPGYSDSTLHTALDVLYSIDYNYSQGQLDQYFGRSRVLIPSEFIKQGEKKIVNGESFVEIMDAPLKDDFFLRLPGRTSIDGKEPEPKFLQPDLRAEQRKFIRDADLELLASKVGLSSATLANHLSYNGTKTATQVNDEQDTTEKSVKRKRKLASKAINAMLKDVAQYYGFFDDVKIIFTSAAGNSAQENDQLRADYEAGLLPLREYIKRRHPDLDEETIEKWVQDIKQEQKERREAEQSKPFGGLDL